MQVTQSNSPFSFAFACCLLFSRITASGITACRYSMSICNRSILSSVWYHQYGIISMISSVWYHQYDIISMVSSVWYHQYDIISTVSSVRYHQHGIISMVSSVWNNGIISIASSVWYISIASSVSTTPIWHAPVPVSGHPVYLKAPNAVSS
jgi:hypothetical protein